MADSTPKELFLNSLHRCTREDGFIPAFYDQFIGTSEEIANKFKNTNFEVQNQMLLNSLTLIAGATNGEMEALHELRARAETHNRDHLDIEPRLYEIWKTAIIDSARNFDHEWDNDTESAWNLILGFAIRHMTNYY